MRRGEVGWDADGVIRVTCTLAPQLHPYADVLGVTREEKNERRKFLVGE